ncbi:hypothetical protein [Telmatospirillum sp.]|uniref:hypothetical protein n=1 Tax=Telmatospirillum sp. TaxID=2079197 RepID=UPI002844A23B|nr:hypothetical protein [Telmatospirillum sp.]MDR3437276.1 hypothetical protein [Telmatospirillum sp.]
MQTPQDISPPQPITPALSAQPTPPPPPPPAPAPAARKHEDRKPQVPENPKQLISLDETEVQSLLGPPVAVEDHSPGKTWRFRKQDCLLNVALYPDVETRVFRVLSYEVTSDDHNDRAKRLCEAKFGIVATD